MEGDLPPPSGDDERLSRSGQSSNRLRSSGRAPLTAVDSASGEVDSVTSMEATRTKLRRYREVVGAPTEIPDLRLDGLMSRIVPRSPWGTTIRIFLFETAVMPSIRDDIEAKLAGRDPLVTLNDNILTATFQLEDGSPDSRKRAMGFGRALALLLDGVHDVRVGYRDEIPGKCAR